LINYYANMDSANITLGSQDIAITEEGSLTGEISGSMLKDLNCKYTIIGHSERRNILGEDFQCINNKLLQCIDNEINPIICIGENEEDRSNGNTFNVLDKQLSAIFTSINVPIDLNLIIAYEPIWAIGSGKVATTEVISETNYLIGDILNSLNSTMKYSIIYGGSVNSKNAEGLLKIDNLDGFLIGGASLNADEFLGIHQKCKERTR